ncbi:ARID/BRIGHT DNA binding domain-containing protein [Phthorimaea operculella]|nr:ARID/BRIGHT DNA binding domain-containing protein [Phthorimaea operculella]
MEKPSFKLVGSPCGQQGQYTFYKALRVTTGKTDKIIAIGDFFFVRIWQDSELVSIGELQLLWTDRVSEQTLVSLRLYFLPENTPDGRSQHGEDEVLALNEKVVIRADDLLSWITDGAGWRCGLRAVWRGACAPPSKAAPAPPSDPLHHTKLDFSDVDKEKSTMEPDTDSPGVVVFSYPRYCRYRALLARLEGMQSAWLRDSLVAALGGYAAATNNTCILYCKDTFEYPELEGHEFVCNHLAPRLKGRPRGRRKRAHRSRSHSRSSRSSDSETNNTPAEQNEQKISPRRLSLRNGSSDKQSEAEPEDEETSPEDQQFLNQLKQYYITQGVSPRNLTVIHGLKDLSLRSLYNAVSSLGGYEAVCRDKLWRKVHPSRPGKARGLYVRYLRPYENHERSNGRLKPNGKIDDKSNIVTIHLPDSPKPESKDCKEEKPDVPSQPVASAEELNQQFLDSISTDTKSVKEDVKDVKPLISVKPPQLLIDPDKQKQSVIKLFEENSGLVAELTAKYNVADDKVIEEVGGRKLSDGSCQLLGELARRLQPGNTDASFLKDLSGQDLANNALSSLSNLVNGHTPASTDQRSRPLGRSSLRHVRVKPTRPPTANTTPVPRSDSNSNPSPPSSGSNSMPPVTNFGIHHPQPRQQPQDDDVLLVPYKPKTPEIIDLDEYPESPQSPKKKKLDILKERGLEVTAVNPPAPVAAAWPTNTPILLNPAVQHQIMTQASLFQMYNIIPQNYANGIQPPRVIQSTCLYGTASPEKTVYGNPKDPFMPPPHVFQGTPIKPQRTVTSDKVEIVPTRQDILDLTCKTSVKPTVEIVRVPSVPSPSKSAQNLAKNYTLVDGKAVVGSNLEITLVSPKSQTPPKNRQPQKRSSNGKFMSSKTPTPPKDFSKDYPRNFPSPSSTKTSPTVKKASNSSSLINIPTYQISKDDMSSPTSSTGSRDSQQNLQNNLLQNVFKGQPNLAQLMELQKGQLGQNLTQNLGSIGQNLTQMMDLQKSVPLSPFVDPMYMSALYSSLAGQMDQRQLAMYRDLMANQFRYSGLLGGVATPTTKN